MLIQDAIEKITGKVAGCPEPELINAYRYALIEFCEKTRAMSAWVTTTTAAMAVATISPDQQVIDIVDALLDGGEIDVVGIMDRAITEATAEKPVLTWRNPNLPQVIPQPELSREVQMFMVFAPGPTAQDVEDAIWLRYSEALDHGALARLFAEPKQPYTDAGLATYHRTLFDNAISEAASVHGKTITRVANRLRTGKQSI